LFFGRIDFSFKIDSNLKLKFEIFYFKIEVWKHNVIKFYAVIYFKFDSNLKLPKCIKI